MVLLPNPFLQGIEVGESYYALVNWHLFTLQLTTKSVHYAAPTELNLHTVSTLVLTLLTEPRTFVDHSIPTLDLCEICKTT